MSWMEGKIREVLVKTKKGKEPGFLELCTMVSRFKIQSFEEQHNFDTALFFLLRKKLVVEDKDEKDFKFINWWRRFNQTNLFFPP